MLWLVLQLYHHQIALLIFISMRLSDGLAALLTQSQSLCVSLHVPSTTPPAQLSNDLLLGFRTGTRARSECYSQGAMA